ncbi:THAP domain-containing protein [Phthorimaea operculella]|nr:THAP domain-containing protein [Phthorimaea operculella]
MRISKYCIAYNCLNNSSDKSLKFHKLPRDMERRREWLIAIDREDLLKRENLKSSSHEVCSAHFEESQMIVKKYLKDDAVPKLKVSEPYKTQEVASSEASIVAVKIEQEEEGTSDSETKPTQENKPTTQIKGPLCCQCKKEFATKTYSVETQTEDLTQDEPQTTKSVPKSAPRKRKLVKDDLMNL